MKPALERPRGRAAGFSLVEMLFVVALLGLVLGSVAMMSDASERAYRTGATLAQLEQQATNATERVVADLRLAGLATIAPDPLPGQGASSLQYVQAVGFDGTDVTWSSLRRLALELEPGELDDGLDNNGNGLIDERRLVLTEDLGGPSERRIVLTRWVAELLQDELPNGVDDNGNGLVDEPGFIVERNDRALVVRLSLQRRDAEGRLLTRTTRTSTTPRN